MNLKTRIWLTLSQIVNQFKGGDPDECLSARAWREYVNSTPGWEKTKDRIDRFFLLYRKEHGHCRKNYEAALERADRRKVER